MYLFKFATTMEAMHIIQLYYSIFDELHKLLEVGVCVHGLHKIGQHFITEDIVTLQKEIWHSAQEAEWHY